MSKFESKAMLARREARQEAILWKALVAEAERTPGTKSYEARQEAILARAFVKQHKKDQKELKELTARIK